MAFNLKNKKEAQGVGVGMSGAWGTFKQVSVNDIENAKTQEELENYKTMLAREQIQNPDLMAALEAKKKNLNMTQMTQNMTNVAPVEEGSPMTVLPTANSFNLKKIKTAQVPGMGDSMQVPADDMGLNDTPELMGDQIEEQQNVGSVPQPPFSKFEDFIRWMDNTDQQSVLQAVSGPDTDHIKDATQQYFATEDEGEKGQIAASIFADPSFPLRETGDVMAQPKHFGEIQDIIKKVADEVVKRVKSSSFNLKKQAQHKTLNNVITWGPQPTPRIDPFLRQPVSDWHIMERNKGFGLVVDDIWDIDYEAIWRQNIMDKYSRAYRDKDGNWVGGYLNKRFEIDRNVPVTSNYQLKPGQRRKPVLPEYGNTESRLQAARANGDVEGALDTSKPFNWKEASSKKKS